MYVKIKLEHQENETIPKSSFVELGSNVTIYETKEKLEEYVNISPNMLKISHMGGNLDDNMKLCDIFKESTLDGKIAMLFTNNDEQSRDGKFVCFLQFYTNAEATQQKTFEELRQSRPQPQPLVANETSGFNVINSSDESNDEESLYSGTVSTSSSYETSSSGSLSEKSGSVTSSDSSTSEKKRKRLKKTLKAAKKAKLIKSTSIKNIPTILQNYLEEFPNHQLNYEEKQNSVECEKSPENHQVQSDSTQAELNTNDNNEKNDEGLSHTNIISTNSTFISAAANDSFTEMPPFALIEPEKRHLIAVIKSEKTLEDTNQTSAIKFEKFFNYFYNIFHCSEKSSILNFNESSATTFYKGNLLIACEDMNTLTWLLDNMEKSFTAIRFMEEYGPFHNYSVTVPRCDPNTIFTNIFKILEMQNKNLSTTKWIINERKIITNTKDDPNYERLVSYLTVNEIVFLSIDNESHEYLKTVNYKLKYCFWKLTLKNECNCGCFSSN